MKDNYGDKITVKTFDVSYMTDVYVTFYGTDHDRPVKVQMELSPDKARKFIKKIRKAINTLEGK